MLNDIFNFFSSAKESISYLFDRYLGIKLNLSNFTIIDEKNLYIKLNDINIDSSKINNKYLKDLNIKLTKGKIDELELKLGPNIFEIKISKISAMIMPVAQKDTKTNKEVDEKEIIKKDEIGKKEDKEKDNNKKPEYIIIYL